MTRKLRRGEPKDVPGRCNARLYLGDNFGDNHATCLCALTENHEGRHEEHSNPGGHNVVITWEGSDEPEYDTCFCHCGRKTMQEIHKRCLHKFVDDECLECGMTTAEHEEIIKERSDRRIKNA